MLMNISDIYIPERIRKNAGNLEELAKSIKMHGLINPITVMESDDKFILIAGYRRLLAVQRLGWTQVPVTVLSLVDAQESLRLEIEENEIRKDFTPSQRIDYAQKLRAIEEEKARKRMATHITNGSGLPSVQRGRVRDIIAPKVGLKSGRQLDRIYYIAEHRPDLMNKVDAGLLSITSAYEEARGFIRHKKKVTTASASIPESVTYESILDEIKSAVEYFMFSVENASYHYKHIKQTDARSEAIFDLLKDVSEDAMSVFDENGTAVT